MENVREPKEEYYFPIVVAGSSLLLYLASLYNYLFFHVLVEMFTLVIIFGIFVVSWASRSMVKSDFLLMLGVGYFFVGLIDLVHILTYRGMNIFPLDSADIPTQLWIAARYLESVAFLAAFLFLGKADSEYIFENKKRIAVLFSIYAAVSIFTLLAIFFWKIFPSAFVEGLGLTPFKIISEYIISFLFLVSIFLIFKKREHFPREMLNLFVFALSTKIIAELCFTEYASVYGFSNILGHIFKFMSFLFLFKILIEFGMRRPYEFLFQDLKRSEESLKHQASFPQLNPNPVIEMDLAGNAVFVNPAAEILMREQSREKEDIGFFLPKNKRSMIKKMTAANVGPIYYEIKAGKKSLGLSASFIPDLDVIRVYGIDISERKQTEAALRKSQLELQRRTEQQLEESYKHLGMINRKVSVILEMEEFAKKNRKITEITDFITQSAVTLSGANFGMLFQYDSPNFKLLACLGFNRDKKPKLHLLKRADVKFLEILVKARKRVSGFCEIIDIGPLHIDPAIGYFVALPLVNQKTLMGFVFLGFKDGKSLGSQDLEFLEVFSVHAGISYSRIENS